MYPVQSLVSGRILIFTLLVCLVLVLSLPATAQKVIFRTHPLDPLTAAEMSVAVETLKRADKLGPAVRFGSITLHEPSKSQHLGRMADALLYDWTSGKAYEAVIDLPSKKLFTFAAMQPNDPPVRCIMINRLNEIVLSDKRFQAILRRRGIQNANRISILGGLLEGQKISVKNGDRVIYAFATDRDSLPPHDTIEALSIEVNLTRGSIIRLVDTYNAKSKVKNPVQAPSDFGKKLDTPKSSSKTMPASKNVHIVGSEVRWGNWKLHFAVHPRRGLEVFDVGWREGGRYRSILYRASLAETIAPYGDPQFTNWYPMDEGDYGMGVYSRSSAVIAADAPAGAAFANSILADDRGRAVSVERAVAIYERDAGVLWRHGNVSHRAHQLVLSGYMTIDNYDYLIHWIFSEDGAIDIQVQLTGIMNVRSTPAQGEVAFGHGGKGAYAHLVAPGVAAPNHQHFFNFRLDFDIDGANGNSVVQMDTEMAPPSPENAKGEWFQMRERIFNAELEARTDLSMAHSRRWKIISSSQYNALGQPTGYTLLPGENSPPYVAPNSMPIRKAGFITHQLWVTPYHPDEMYPAGPFPSLNFLDDGLPTWTAANRSVKDTDIVVWYTLGITHLPRTEDYPVMPTHTAGFRLVPSGFFSQNPVLGGSKLVK